MQEIPSPTLERRVTIREEPNSAARSPPRQKRLTIRRAQSMLPEQFMHLVNTPKVETEEDKVRAILQKPVKSKDDAKYLYKRLADFAFFSHFKENNSDVNEVDAILNLCQTMKYEKFPEKSVVFKQNDPSNDKVYIIFTGEVAIVVKNSTIPVNTLVETPKEIPIVVQKQEIINRVHPPKIETLGIRKTVSIVEKPSIYTFSRQSTKVTNDIPQTPDKPKITLSSLILDYGHEVDRIGKGNYFGEKALIHDRPRGATIITSQDSEFITIDKEQFLGIRRKFEKFKIKQINFMIHYFPGLSRVEDYRIIENLYYVFEEKIFAKGHELSVEGESSDHFSILLDGCLSVQKRRVKKNDGRKRFEESIDKFYTQSRDRIENLEIMNITGGSITGEEILFNDHQQYEFTITVISPTAKIFLMNRAKFLIRFPPDVIASLKEQSLKKKELYYRIFEDKIKFLKSEMESPTKIEGTKKIDSPLKVDSPTRVESPRKREIESPRKKLERKLTLKESSERFLTEVVPESLIEVKDSTAFSKEFFETRKNDSPMMRVSKKTSSIATIQEEKPTLDQKFKDGIGLIRRSHVNIKEDILRNEERFSPMRATLRTKLPKLDVNEVDNFKFDFGVEYNLPKSPERKHNNLAYPEVGVENTLSPVKWLDRKTSKIQDYPTCLTEGKESMPEINPIRSARISKVSIINPIIIAKQDKKKITLSNMEISKSTVLSKLLNCNLSSKSSISTTQYNDLNSSPKKLPLLKPQSIQHSRAKSIGVSPFKPRLMECCFLSGINSDR